MTGLIVLDVIIGLVFIYTLYSLLTTTVVEIVATIFQLRARTLHQGIKRMLDDDQTTVFSKFFYQEPTIKYLSSGFFGLFNKPSYLKNRNFSKAVIELLKRKSTIEGKNLDKIKDALTNPQEKSETLSFIQSLYHDADGNLEEFEKKLEKWFDDTMERVSGWYKRNIQLYTFISGLLIATLFGVDTISLSTELANDKIKRDVLVSLTSPFSEEYSKFNDKEKEKKNKLLNKSLNNLPVLGIKKEICDYTTINWMGIFLTGIALSLGSPFWFDLLNKLIKFRSSISPKKQKKSNN